MKTILIGAGVALALSAAPAWAEDFHCPKPGTVIAFSSDMSGTFLDQTGMFCRVLGIDGKVYETFLGLAGYGIADDPNVLIRNFGQRLFPLKVGNEIEFKSQVDSSHVDHVVPGTAESFWIAHTIKVDRQEKITTRAGTFDTYVIEWHRQALGRINGSWLITFWFAPELGYTVKNKFETLAGYGPNKSMEITSLSFSNTVPTVVEAEPCFPGVKFGVYDDCQKPASQPAVSTPAPAAPLATIAPTAGAAPRAPAPTPVAPSATLSVEDRLNALKDLRDRKVITPEEYAAKRKEILKSL